VSISTGVALPWARTRQADVEDHQVVGVLPDRQRHRFAARRHVDRPALRAQGPRGGVGQRRVVFDEQDVHGQRIMEKTRGECRRQRRPALQGPDEPK
jgi:hypothetical protein